MNSLLKNYENQKLEKSLRNKSKALRIFERRLYEKYLDLLKKKNAGKY
jgi:hypothetical protein